MPLRQLRRIGTVLLLVVLAAAPARAHLSETTPFRAVILAEAEGRTIAFLRVSLPLVVARDLAWSAETGSPLSLPFLKPADGGYQFDAEGLAQSQDLLVTRLVQSHDWRSAGAPLEVKLLRYRVDGFPVSGRFDSAAAAARTLAIPSNAGGMPLTATYVDFALDLGPAPLEAPITFAATAPPVALPPGAVVENHLIDERSGRPLLRVEPGQLQRPVAVSMTPGGLFAGTAERALTLGWGCFALAVAALALVAARRRHLAWLALGFVVGQLFGRAAVVALPLLAQQPAHVHAAAAALALALPLALGWSGRRVPGILLALAALVVAASWRLAVASDGVLRSDHRLAEAGMESGLLTGLVLALVLALAASLLRWKWLGARRPQIALVAALMLASGGAWLGAPLSGESRATVLQRIGRSTAVDDAIWTRELLAELVRDLHLACAEPEPARRRARLASLARAPALDTLADSACADLAGAGLPPEGPPFHDVQFLGFGLRRAPGEVSIDAQWQGLGILDPVLHTHQAGRTYAASLTVARSFGRWRIATFTLTPPA